ncbi:hypothetical protein DFQ14_10890 [Halopolyspora algeriensis]|uniref:Uncharacterized protein n=1 Tax=Halopolyspora algeriensis TaxID=1500506 RepID=A0A368VMX5_9ACTN|nr:hypothetical protein [Halopolyspora algeriensis]RCW42834.1 hypothetical protein DFQ14_10890 [Halopolyspora algeriensis]TQM56696.1 hypothetical protein FHU43_1510 [Halopolyspora algeriensis]
MSQNTEWKLRTPPQTEVWVDEDVLAMRAPLVRVHRDDAGTWLFDGPGEPPRPASRTHLSAVAGAWPHVAALTELNSGDSVVWSWEQHGWTSEFECRCGNCAQPVATDLDRSTWPSELHPEYLASVESTALSGQIMLTDILATPGGIALLGPGGQNRTSEEMTPVALANVIRRWPHTMRALRAVRDGHGMRWNPEELNWHEYMTV